MSDFIELSKILLKFLLFLKISFINIKLKTQMSHMQPNCAWYGHNDNRGSWTYNQRMWESTNVNRVSITNFTELQV